MHINMANVQKILQFTGLPFQVISSHLFFRQPMNDNKNEWFKTWFDSPFYALLYKNRSFEEAAAFIDRLILTDELKEIHYILDLACGRGRHAVHFHQIGFDVVGLDLSKNSIAFAKQFEQKGLAFENGDMRFFELERKFDAVFNLFTSFGYFHHLEENIKVLQNVHKHLKPNGVFVIDYFNAQKVINDLKPQETKIIDGVGFDIRKRVENGQIIKTIDVKDTGATMHFEERVQLIYASEFISMLEENGFKILHTFGDYNLASFEEAISERFISIAQRI